jgi:hypothetical protein
MSYLRIGSGDANALMMGLQTKGYAELWRKFLSDQPPHYNSYASPIDALRTGAILEDRYSFTLAEDYYLQVKESPGHLNCCSSSLDFAKIREGKVLEFEELKTIFLPDYLAIIKPAKELKEAEQLQFLKKKFKSNYTQVQFQLMCTGLGEATLAFLSVETYEDSENALRIIKDEDVTKFRILRDQPVIDLIESRASIFQSVKDHFVK